MEGAAEQRSGQDRRDERRRSPGRRGSVGRREEDQRRHLRSLAATFLSFCGALAVMYLFVGLVGAIDFREAALASGIAIGMALLWLAGAYQRARTGAGFVTRTDRERRGF